MKTKTLLIILAFFINSQLLINNLYPQVIQQWAARYNGPGNSVDVASSIAVDNFGNSYVTGYTKNGALDADYATIKYNSTGIQQWARTYNGLGTSVSYDEARAIAVDINGNVYVTGTSRGNGTGVDIATIKYNSSGTQQWVQRYNGPPGSGDDGGYSIAVDDFGNVYITGDSRGNGSGQDYITIKYNTDGVLQWESR